jgi:hypothetical protein
MPVQEKIRNASSVRALVCHSPEENTDVRKIVLTLASVAALGIALPVVTAPAAQARDVVIIKKKHRHWNRHWDRHWDRGHHYGWYKHRHHHRHGATVVVR